MILLGHLSGSYLLAQIPSLFGQPLPLPDQFLIISAGVVLDLDLLISKHLVKSTFNHHYSVTHTPIFVLLLFTAFYIFFGHKLTNITSLLVLVSLMMHLALDDISYWFTRLGLEKSSPQPQIYWLYPFDHRRLSHQPVPDVSFTSVLKNYYFHAPWTFGTEIVLSLLALLVILHK